MKNVLVTVLGLSPAVVTETLWALAHRTRNGRPDPFRPDAVHILTTGEGHARMKPDLLDPGRTWDALTTALGLPPDRPQVHFIPGRLGLPLADIRTVEDNTALADAVVRLIGDLTRDPEVRIHASLAGGRKTMSFYMGYVMSLFGRVQDELSHVLVNPPEYEKPGFWYPTAATPDAVLELAGIPFVRLAHYLDPAQRERLRHGSFHDVVTAVAEALLPPKLVLIDRTREVRAGERPPFRLEHQHYAMYRLLARAVLDGCEGAGPAGLGAGHKGWLTAADFFHPDDPRVLDFVDGYERLFDHRRAQGAAKLEHRLDMIRRDFTKRPAPGSERGRELRRKMNAIFSPIVSGTAKAVRDAIPDPMLRVPFAVHQEDSEPSRFGLLLEPAQIEIREA